MATCVERLQVYETFHVTDDTSNPITTWPSRLDSPLSWAGADFSDEKVYTYFLSTIEIAEVTSALRHFQDLKIGIEHVKRETFPLPNLSSQLLHLKAELFDGKGFFILRGLQPEKFSGEENAIITLGISSYVHEKRIPQNKAGEMIRHIIDADWTGAPKEKRQFGYSNVAHDFHTDFACSVLVMYTVNTSAEGGNSNLSSSWHIFNHLVKTRPDVIYTLSKNNWAHDTSTNDDPTYFMRSILSLEDGKPILNFERRALLGSTCSPRSPTIPAADESQKEALDIVQMLARKFQLSTKMQRGDMRFINNLALLHSRDSFVDNESSKRHLIRLWLQREEGETGWKTPEAMEHAIRSTLNTRPLTAGETFDTEVNLTSCQVTLRTDSCS